MDVIWYKLSDSSKDQICDQLIETSWEYLDKWMKQNYRATRHVSSENEFYYRFKDAEKYTEFCLKWL